MAAGRAAAGGERMPTTARKSERLEARVDPGLKELIERAASLRGQTVTGFIVDSVQRAAEEALRAEQIVLSARDSAAFVQAVLEPAEPNERLLRAARRHDEFVRDGN
jgi:uncharacterized protein (DUF1778 family)